MQYAWSVLAPPRLNLSSAAVVPLGTAAPYFLLVDTAIPTAVGAAVRAQVTVTDAAGAVGTAEFATAVNAVPRGGTLALSPARGGGANAPLTLNASGWVDPDIGDSTGLVYAFSVFDPVLNARRALASAPSAGSTLATRLPLVLTPTMVTFYVTVSDADGGEATASALAPVTPTMVSVSTVEAALAAVEAVACAPLECNHARSAAALQALAVLTVFAAQDPANGALPGLRLRLKVPLRPPLSVSPASHPWGLV
jgi:hypothetical protein